MSIRINRIWIDYDNGDKSHRKVFDHKAEIELADLVSELERAPDRLVEADVYKFPIFNRDGHASIVREVGPNGAYFLSLRPEYALSDVVVDPDDLFVDLKIVKDRIVYCFYNGTRRQAISITATIAEDIAGVARELSTGLSDPIWRQYFIRKALRKPDAKPLSAPGESYPEILTASQVARYLAVEEKTIRNWTSERKIPFKKAGSNVRYRKTEIDAALDRGELGKKPIVNKRRGQRRSA